MAVSYHPHKDMRDWKKAVERCLRDLREIEQEFDLIAVRGASGLVVGSIVAYTLQKHLLVVRKGEFVHSGVETIDPGIPKTGDRTVILDDFICTGSTMKAIQEVLDGPARFICLYGNSLSSAPSGGYVPDNRYLWRKGELV